MCVLLLIIYCLLLSFFFFQAEDGIRDLVRSRGLGDVYKRQVDELVCTILSQNTNDINRDIAFKALKARYGSWQAVSYTHLTLPTIYSV